MIQYQHSTPRPVYTIVYSHGLLRLRKYALCKYRILTDYTKPYVPQPLPQGIQATAAALY